MDLVTEVLKKHLIDKHGASALYIGTGDVEFSHYCSVHDFYHSQEERTQDEKAVSN